MAPQRKLPDPNFVGEGDVSIPRPRLAKASSFQVHSDAVVH